MITLHEDLHKFLHISFGVTRKIFIRVKNVLKKLVEKNETQIWLGC
jgi:hypothetical protein